MTRTQNSFLNFITNLISTFLVVLLNFIIRSVFIRTLGTSYLGIEGYFSSILSMLSLTELGFGSAIVFKLYKPIEQGDRHRVQVLMKLYRQVYRIIGWVIVGLGLCLIPFLPRLIRDYDHLLELRLNPAFIFLLYLFNSASSYWFFAYKSAFVSATQKTYLLQVTGYAINIVGCVAQILALHLTKNFIVYIGVMIAQSLVRNLLYAAICDKRYPYLKEKVNDRVSREELKEFFKDCSALLIYKLNAVVIRGTDSIILTGFVGISYTALYANYISVRANLEAFLSTFTRSINASLGSLYSTGNLAWSRLVFRVVNFSSAWLYGVGAIGVAVLADDFISMWVGPRFVVTSFTAASGVTAVTPLALWLGIEVYLNGQKVYLNTCRGTMGLFQQIKYRPVLGMIVNMAVCLYLVPRVGIAGCVISTNCAALVNIIFDPIVIHKVALKCSPRGYFLKNLLYKAIVICSGLLCWWLCRHIPLTGIAGFLVHGCVCVAIPSAVFFLCFFRTVEFRFLIHSLRDLAVSKFKTDTKTQIEGGDTNA